MELESTLAAIEVVIDNAVADEARTARVREVIRVAAEKNGDRITSEEIGQGVEFVVRYVRSVPAVLREALERSVGTFAEDKMKRMVHAAAAYWDADDDVIPDDQGLLGILDDAYCSLSLVGALSSRYAKSTGNRLVSTELEGPSSAVRRLLGDPIADKLDDYVEEALADATLTELLESLKDEPLPPPPTHSSWGGNDDDLILKLFGVLGD